MSDEQASVGEKFDPESEQEKKLRGRSERIRKWRKEMRRGRSNELDDAMDLPVSRRFIPL